MKAAAMSQRLLLPFLPAILSLGLFLSGAQTPPTSSVPESVAAVLKARCLECHAGPKPAEALSLEPDKILAATLDKPTADDPATKLIDSANPEKSYVLAKIRGDRTIRGSRMPARRPRLTDGELKLLQDWVLSLKSVAR
jgi:hypothetical protein